MLLPAPLADGRFLAVPNCFDGTRPNLLDLPRPFGYLQHRGILDTSKSRVYCFVGDGSDLPETLGAITLACREKLDNLVWVVNCNLQRLDGPVRGNGKIIQELEGAFRGAGWNVVKTIWGNDWDAILAKDTDGKIVKRMGEIVDGQYQNYISADGSYIREHFFNTPNSRRWSTISATSN